MGPKEGLNEKAGMTDRQAGLAGIDRVMAHAQEEGGERREG